MYVCMYVYMYVCMYIHVCTYGCMYVCIRTWVLELASTVSMNIHLNSPRSWSYGDKVPIQASIYWREGTCISYHIKMEAEQQCLSNSRHHNKLYYNDQDRKDWSQKVCKDNTSSTFGKRSKNCWLTGYMAWICLYDCCRTHGSILEDIL